MCYLVCVYLLFRNIDCDLFKFCFFKDGILSIEVKKLQWIEVKDNYIKIEKEEEVD